MFGIRKLEKVSKSVIKMKFEIVEFNDILNWLNEAQWKLIRNFYS